MATTVKLLNGSDKNLKAGDPVKLHATKLKSFDYANLGDILIGTLASQTNRGSYGVINLLGGNITAPATELTPDQIAAIAKQVGSTPGPKGDKGDPGLQGLKGDAGTKGDQGSQGLKGDTGSQGNPGTNGINGTNGTTPVKNIDYFDGAKGDKGDVGTQGIPGNNGVTGQAGSDGKDGAAGTPGLKGDKGDQGIAGNNGSQGLKGDQGIQGVPGQNGTNAPVRLFANLAAPVVTSGTTEKVLLQLQIPTNSAVVGSTYRAWIIGNSSSTGTLIFKVRCGNLGTISDTIDWTAVTSAAQVANARAGFDVLITIRSTTTIKAEGVGYAGAVQLPTTIAAPTAPAIAISGVWYINLTVICSVGTFTAQVANIEEIR